MYNIYYVVLVINIVNASTITYNNKITYLIKKINLGAIYKSTRAYSYIIYRKFNFIK